MARRCSRLRTSPSGGDPDAALIQLLGSEAVSELRALNAALPESQPVVVLSPDYPGIDLLLRRLFAKRPCTTVPSLALMSSFAKEMASSAVVVTFGRFRPEDADDVFEAKTFRAWKRRK